MKNLKIFILIMMLTSLIACPNNNEDPKTDNTGANGKDKIASLQAVIDDPNTKDGDVINLSEYPNITNYNADINKAVTIDSSADIDLSSAKLSVSKDGVNLTGLVNANVTTNATLGSGSLKISSSSLASLVLNGGGANSIHLDGVTVQDLTADYPWVRLHIEGTNTKITNFAAVRNCIIEDDETQDTAHTKAFVDNLKVSDNVIAEVKTVIDKLDIAGEGAEVNLNRANAFIKGLSNAVVSESFFGSFRLTSKEEVDMPSILTNILGNNDTYRKQIQYKTSEMLVGIQDRAADSYDNVSYNFDGFVKAWKRYIDNSDDQEEQRIWSNYQHVRVLDKYNGVSIKSVRAKAFQMSQWLTSVDIGENVTSIGELAFLGCSNLDKVYMRPTEPPRVDGDMLFFTTDDASSDKTKLDRSLFDPTNDFISAECIDYFIEWYAGSDYAGDDGRQVVADMKTAVAGINGIYSDVDVSTIGKFLKSKFMRDLPDTAYIAAEAQLGIDVRPDTIVDKIMSEWDKTLTQIDMSKVTIYVPVGSVAAYTSAAGWSRYADRIMEIQTSFIDEVHAE